MQLGDLTLNIIVNLSNAEGKIKSFTTELKETEQAIKKTEISSVSLHDKLQNLALRFQGVQAVISILRNTFGDLLKEYENQEIAISKLENGLKNVGEGYDALNRLSIQASELQKITPFSDEEINNAQAMLTTFMKSSEEIEILTPRILDLAAAYMESGDKSMSLQQVAVMLGKVNEETIGVLRRVGVAFTTEQEEKLKSLKGTEQAIYLSKILDQNFKGMAETIGSTAAGKLRIFQNAINEFKESLGKIVSEILIPIISPLKAIAEWLQTQPNNIKIASLAIITLATAWLYLNNAMNPTVGAFIAISSITIALPPALRLVAGTLALVLAAVIALNGGLTILNISLGGLPIIIGLIATAAVAIGSVFLESKQSIENFKQKIQDTYAEIEKHDADIQNLKDLQSQLANVSNLSAEEQAKYNERLFEAARLHPEIVSGINNQTGALQINLGTLQQVIEKEEYINKLRRDNAINEQVLNIRNIIDEHGKEIEKQQELQSELEKLIEVKESYIKIEDDEIRTLGPKGELYYSSKQKAIENIDYEINKVQKSLIESASSGDKFAIALDDAVREGVKFGDLGKVIERVKPYIEGNTIASKMFFDTISRYIGIQINDWNTLISAVHNYQNALNQTVVTGPQIQNREYFQKEINRLTKERDLLTYTDKKGIEKYNKQIAELEKKMSVYDFKPSQGRISTSRVKYEKDNSEEIARDQERIDLDISKKKSELIETEYKRRKALIENEYYEELYRIKYLTNATEEQRETLRKLADDKKEYELRKLDEDINKTLTEEIYKILTRERKFLEEKKEIDKEIRNQRIEAIEDESERRRAKIQATYDDELEKIKKLKATSEQKDELNRLATQKQQKELSQVQGEEQLRYFYQTKSIAEQIQNIFQFGSNTVFYNFVRALQVAEQIINLFKTIDAVKTVVNIFSSILGFFLGSPEGGGAIAGGFATGGLVPGSGSGDTVLALLTPGEFVIRKSRVQELGLNFLNWLNGYTVNHTIGRYANGGFVKPHHNNILKLEVEDIKIDGKSLYLVWKRTNEMFNKRNK